MRQRCISWVTSIALLVSSFFLSSLLNQAQASPVSGVVEVSNHDVEYKSLTTEFAQKLERLEKLGGGIKPFGLRLASIDESYSAGKTTESLELLKNLSQQVDQQLEAITALRAKKPAAVASLPQPAGHKGSEMAQILNDSRVRSTIANYAKSMEQNGGSQKSYSSFSGSAEDYIAAVAKDVISRELGGLNAPVQGPFLLERFRNLQRINELRKHGDRIDGFLTYHKHTEDIASVASRDSTRMAELSQRVLYLRQQLGLSPLSSSLKISQFQ